MDIESRSFAPKRVVRSVARRARPDLVHHRLTDDPVVCDLRRAADLDAVVAVYDDGATPHATPADLERELGVSVPPDRDLHLPSTPEGFTCRSRRTVRTVTLADADPPAVLLSRRSLRGWGEAVRNFAIAHEFGHLVTAPADSPSLDAAVESLRPAPDRSGLALRALVAAHREFRAGEAHADLGGGMADRHRVPASALADYREVERAGERGPALARAEQRALGIRNGAKYLPLPDDVAGVDVGAGPREALTRPLPRYLDWVDEWSVDARRRA